MDVASISSVGGGAAAFGPFQGGSTYPYPPYPTTYRNAYTFQTVGSSAPETAGYGPHDMLDKCESTARKIRERHRERYGVFEGSIQNGDSRRGALFCRSGTWLEIVDERTAARDAPNPTEADTVRGSLTENTRYGALDFISVAIGLISIRGVEANRYLCMNNNGTLYSTQFSNFSAECVFLEEMMDNYYNLYSSCVFGSRRRPWYVALRRTGRPRKGKNTRRRRKASHFLVVHYDEAPLPSHRDISLADLLNPSLKHQPPHNKAFRARGEISNRVEHRKPRPREPRKKKKRRREQRLQREEQQRRLRKQEIEQLRAAELARQNQISEPPISTARPRLSGAGLQMKRPNTAEYAYQREQMIRQPPPATTPRLSGAGLEIRPRRHPSP